MGAAGKNEIREEWEDNAAEMFAEGGFWNNTGGFGIMLGRTTLDLFSLGSFGKNDKINDQILQGKVSSARGYTGMVGNGGIAALSVTAGGGAGGLVLKAGGTSLKMFATAGAVSGATYSATDTLATRASYGALGIEYGNTWGQDAKSFLFSTAAGGTLGFGAGAYVKYPAVRNYLNQPLGGYKEINMQSKYLGEETGAVWGTKVKYLTNVEREAYKLQIKDGKLFTSDGVPFDTSGTSRINGKAIFVMDKNGNIFASNVQEIGLFHHSSFLAGGPVAAAGEISVSNGIVKAVTLRSGHYQPPVSYLYQFLLQLRKMGIDISKIEIERGF